MPKFATEEAKQKWLEACRKTRAANKGKKKVSVVARGRSEFKKRSGTGIYSAQQEMIDKIDDAIARLEEAKIGLIKGQQSLNSIGEL